MHANANIECAQQETEFNQLIGRIDSLLADVDEAETDLIAIRDRVLGDPTLRPAIAGSAEIHKPPQAPPPIATLDVAKDKLLQLKGAVSRMLPGAATREERVESDQVRIATRMMHVKRELAVIAFEAETVGMTGTASALDRIRGQIESLIKPILDASKLQTANELCTKNDAST